LAILELSNLIIGIPHADRFSITKFQNSQLPNLFHFFVRRVLAATAAEFFELQPLGRRFPILGRRIIPLFAVTAL
jgi:hypothetical protein